MQLALEQFPACAPEGQGAGIGLGAGAEEVDGLLSTLSYGGHGDRRCVVVVVLYARMLHFSVSLPYTGATGLGRAGDWCGLWLDSLGWHGPYQGQAVHGVHAVLAAELATGTSAQACTYCWALHSAG